jgi:hypothetical protein
MNKDQTQELLIGVFLALRQNGLRRNGSGISIGELLDGLKMAENVEVPAALDYLQQSLRLLWGGGTKEFKDVWESRVAALNAPARAALTPVPVGDLPAPFAPAAVGPVRILAPQTESQELVAALAGDGGTSEPEAEGGATAAGTEPAGDMRPGGRPRGNGNPNRPWDSSDPLHRRNRRFGSWMPPNFIVAQDGPAPMPSIGALPVKAPAEPPLVGGADTIYIYKPISRLSMTYAWRYLRRPVPDGPANVLDVEETITRVTHQGFFLAPIYRRRQSNHAHLVLLMDQGGSMVPFQSIVQDLIETAQQESSIKQVDVHYFHNFFEDVVYEDRHLTLRKDVEQAMELCTTNTSILIVSDAGAARGRHNAARVRATLRMLSRLGQQTTLVAWLNPMPRERWTGTSAQAITEELQMFQLDNDGFSSAIDALQGRGIAL